MLTQIHAGSVTQSDVYIDVSSIIVLMFSTLKIYGRVLCIDLLGKTIRWLLNSS